MKLKELFASVEVLELRADPETELTGVCYDSRAAKPGDLFVAIRGFSSDGNRFIPNAVAAGAAVVACETAPELDIPYVLVKDSRRALAEVSCAFFDHPAEKMKIIGVTGTSGKTTSTHLIRHILESALGAKVGMIGTNGNSIGDTLLHTEHTTPESYELQKLFARMAEEGCTYAVMEVSSHSLALSRVAGFRFHVAAFTNLSQDHLDFHGTMEEYAKAKKLLFSQCEHACINIDDARGPYMAEGCACPVMRTSAEGPADLYAEDIELTAKGIAFTAVEGETRTETELAIPGSFSVYNALTAISCCRMLGIPLADCAAALKTAGGVKGRVETVPTDGDYTILIDYSHKPDALEKVLRTLRPLTKGRLIALFGCGGDRDRAKRPIMGAVAAAEADIVIVTSDNPRTEEPMTIIDEILAGIRGTETPYEVICDRPSAIRRAIDLAQPGDVILLAGKGHEDYQIIGHDKRHLDEREVVAEYLKEREKSRI